MKAKSCFVILGVLAFSVSINAQWSRSTTGTPRNVYLTTSTDQVGIGTSTPGTGIRFRVLNKSQMDSLYLVHSNALFSVRGTESSGYNYVNITSTKISVAQAVAGPGSTSIEKNLIDVSTGLTGTHTRITGGKIQTPYLLVGNSDVAIGNYKLAVEGKIGAREVVVTNAAWADHVFKNDYKLKPLAEVEKFINDNKHLEGIPTEKEVKADGVPLGEMQAKLLEKVEELTLYVIAQQKEIHRLKDRLDDAESIRQQE